MLVPFFLTKSRSKILLFTSLMTIGGNVFNHKSKIIDIWVCLTCGMLYMLKQLKLTNFYWKSTISYWKVIYLIQNIQVLMPSYYFKLPNMCKFVHDRKPVDILGIVFNEWMLVPFFLTKSRLKILLFASLMTIGGSIAD